MINPRFVFFGTSRLAIIVLEELKQAGFIPALIVTTPDRPKGRKLVLTPPLVKVWADEHSVPILQPEKLRDPAFVVELKKTEWDLFIVAEYGKIIPQNILDLPKHKTLNVHPSLLPKFRGPSPLHAMIMADTKETGVTIMRLDAEMDHGPIVAQEHHTFTEWPDIFELEHILAHKGGKLLVNTISGWLKGEIKETEQNHNDATYCKMITKEDGLLDLRDEPYRNYRKFLAYKEWPTVYFFVDRGGAKVRVKIKDAEYKDGQFVIKRVIPEGKNEMDYENFLRG